MSIEVMRQARNAFVWNLNTDLDNIPACDQWAKMLRKNIYALDQAISEAEKQNKWGGLTDEDKQDWIKCMPWPPEPAHLMVLIEGVELELKDLNNA